MLVVKKRVKKPFKSQNPALFGDSMKQIFGDYNIWQRDQYVFKNNVDRLESGHIISLLEDVGEILLGIKTGSKTHFWTEIEFILLKFIDPKIVTLKFPKCMRYQKLDNLQKYITEVGSRSKTASREMMCSSLLARNQSLMSISSELLKSKAKILKANSDDLNQSKNLSSAMIDRLTLTAVVLMRLLEVLNIVSTRPNWQHRRYTTTTKWD